MRITKHPIIDIAVKESISFKFNGKQVMGQKGDSVASALWANKVKTLRQTEVFAKHRGMYCGIGNCYDCRVYQKEIGMVRACITPIQVGMELFSEDRGDSDHEI